MLDVAINRGFELAGAAVNAAPDLLLGDDREEALDQIEPRGARWRKVHMEARMPYQPAPAARGLVGTVVINDQVEVQAVRCIGVEMEKDLPEGDAARTNIGLYKHVNIVQ